MSNFQVYEAAVKACEATDNAIGRIYESCKKNGGDIREFLLSLLLYLKTVAFLEPFAKDPQYSKEKYSIKRIKFSLTFAEG